VDATEPSKLRVIGSNPIRGANLLRIKHMSLILTTPAALEEYRNRTVSKLKELMSELENIRKEFSSDEDEDNFYNILLEEIYADSEDIIRLEDLLFEIDVSLRNPKLNMQVSIDTNTLDLIVSREGVLEG
jgi:hypothetical protein